MTDELKDKPEISEVVPGGTIFPSRFARPRPVEPKPVDPLPQEQKPQDESASLVQNVESVRNTIRYVADREEYEEELPEGLVANTPEAEEWLRDRSAGWRATRRRKGVEDPGAIRDAVRDGVREGMASQQKDEPMPEEDPMGLLTPQQRREYQRLRQEGSQEEQFDYLFNLALENRKGQVLNYQQINQTETQIRAREQSDAIIRDMRIMHAMNSNFPNPDRNPEDAVVELTKPNGFYEFLQRKKINGPIQSTYEYYLTTIGKGKEAAKRTTTEEVNVPLSVTQKVAERAGKPSDNGAIVGRDEDETEIKACLQTQGIRYARAKYGAKAEEIFNNIRGLAGPRNKKT